MSAVTDSVIKGTPLLAPSSVSVKRSIAVPVLPSLTHSTRKQFDFEKSQFPLINPNPPDSALKGTVEVIWSEHCFGGAWS